ncbi:FRG domain-containing protein [Spongorhabdus nitratireducens]
MREKRKLFTKEIKSLDELFRIVERHSKRYSNVFYRGQANSEWLVTSSYARKSGSILENHEEIKHRAETITAEQKARSNYLISSFDIIDKFINELSIKNEIDYATYMGLAQHYELPTNLIDFSLSPEVALYFAFDYKEEPESGYVSLYITTPLFFEEVIVNDIQNRYAQFSDKKELDLLIRDMIELKKGTYSMTIPRIKIADYQINLRINAQKGCFVYYPEPLPYESIMYRLECWQPQRDWGSQYIIKIPTSLKKDVAQYLKSKNITRKTIYPTVNQDHIPDGSKCFDLALKSASEKVYQTLA